MRLLRYSILRWIPGHLCPACDASLARRQTTVGSAIALRMTHERTAISHESSFQVPLRLPYPAASLHVLAKRRY